MIMVVHEMLMMAGGLGLQNYTGGLSQAKPEFSFCVFISRTEGMTASSRQFCTSLPNENAGCKIYP